MSKVKIGIVQMACGADPAANMQKAVQQIREAAQQGAQIICTQELFMSLYFCDEEKYEHFGLAEPIPGPATEQLSVLAAELKVVIIASLFEKRAQGIYHNTVAVLDADGGTPLIVYRKDRIRCVQGREYLEERRLKPTSPTRRVFAICCNSAMFADFTKGHWLSLYRKRFDADAPPVQMRLMTAERRGDVVLGEDLPNYPGRPGNFLWKLIATWAAMGFRRPDMGLADLPRSIFQNGDPNGRP